MHTVNNNRPSLYPSLFAFSHRSKHYKKAGVYDKNNSIMPKHWVKVSCYNKGGYETLSAAFLHILYCQKALVLCLSKDKPSCYDYQNSYCFWLLIVDNHIFFKANSDHIDSNNFFLLLEGHFMPCCLLEGGDYQGDYRYDNVVDIAVI